MWRKHRGTILFLAGMIAAMGVGWRGFPLALYKRVPQPVQFSHKVHAEKAGEKCEDCHTLRADGTFTGVPALDKCTGCHTQAMGTTAQEKRFIDEYVTPSRELVWQVYARQPENVYFSHAFHVKLAHLKCEQCHGAQGQIDMPPMAQINRISGYSHSQRFLNMDTCMDCHREKEAANSCLACHK